MASVIYLEALNQMARSGINFATGTFKCLLTTSSYTEDKNAHANRTSITNEVASGNGYTTGGNTVAVTVTKDTTNSRIDVSLGGTSWTAGAGQTLTARKAVYYLSTGTAANDILVAEIDFATDQVASNGTLTLTASTLRIQN